MAYQIPKKKLKQLGMFALAAVAIEYVVSRAKQPVAETVDTGLLNTITEGVTNIVGTLTGTKQGDFINKMAPVAAQVQQATGIDPLIIMTQAALESGWGTSGLTRKANNLYGFTGDAALNSWLGQQGLSADTSMEKVLSLDTSAAPFILMQTHEESPTHAKYFSRPGDIISQIQAANGTWDLMVWRPFRRYDSWLASVQDWAHLLSTAPRYSSAIVAARAGEVEAFAQAVAAAGYATDSKYAQKLVSVAGTISQDIQSA